MKCQATRQDGGPCRNWALRGAERCYWHAPGLDELRRQARRKGAILGNLARRADVRELDRTLEEAHWPPALRRMVVGAYVRGSVKEEVLA